MHVKCTQCEQEVGRRHVGRCPVCRGIVAPTYDEFELAGLEAAEIGRGLDRYRSVLPSTHPLPTLGEGDTPLLLSQRIGPALGLEALYFKLESGNPGGAFKDRPAALAAALAVESGATAILTASSGNAGSALAAFSAAAGLRCVVLFEPGNPPGKARQMAVHGAAVLPVEGVFQRHPEAIAAFLLGLSERLETYLAFVWAPVNPFLLEAMKSISYEVVAALGRAPDLVVTPVGGGDLLAGQWRGYQELQALGRLSETPGMVAVQSRAAPPLVRAFESGAEQVPVLERARSGVSGINVAFSGDHALQAVRESGGFAVGVPDEAILTMQARLAKEEGIWVEPAGAAPVAGVEELVEMGSVGRGQRVVCVLSGAGFKDAQLGSRRARDLVERDSVPFDEQAVFDAARAALLAD